MNNFKLRLSDIFKYVILGALQSCLLIIALNSKTSILTDFQKSTYPEYVRSENSDYNESIDFHNYEKMNEPSDISEPSLDTRGYLSSGNIIPPESSQAKDTGRITGQESLVESFLHSIVSDSIVFFVIALCLFYLMGFLTQMIILLFCKGNFMGTGLNEVGCFIKLRPDNFLNLNRYPYWMYYSEHPDKVLGIYREILETNGDSDLKIEYLYANSLFQGLALTICVFSLIDYPGLHFNESIILSILVLAFLCLMGYLSIKYKWAMIINKLSIIVFPLIIMSLAYFSEEKWNVGYICGISLFICLALAEQLSRRQIRRIDMLIKYGDRGRNEKRFLSTLKRNGLPTAFVLTRVSDSCMPYYKEQLESIISQEYPNVKAIVLIDKNTAHKEQFIKIIEEFRTRGLNISYYISNGTGAACLAYEIRELFLSYASKNDVAISLDGDDLFASRHVVSRIMGRISRTGANICLITFEIFGDTNVNATKDHPNEIVKEIAQRYTDKGKSISSEILIKKFNAHLISTLGWTKCYTAEIWQKYHRLWEKENNVRVEFSKYEDFPDIISLLEMNSRICAVENTSILFRKHNGSVTTNICADNYRKHIVHYFKETLKKSRLSHQNYKTRGKNEHLPALSDTAFELIRSKFIPYKFLQYLNIVRKKTSGETIELQDYSANEFFESFVNEVYGLEDRKILIDGMLNILRDNLEFQKVHCSGYFGKDLPEELEKENLSINDLVNSYRLILKTE